MRAELAAIATQLHETREYASDPLIKEQLRARLIEGYQQLLEWQSIHVWTLAQPNGADIGKACTNSECPISQYLQAETGLLSSVGPSIKIGSFKLCKPEFIARIICGVDAIAHGERRAITREQFLDVLLKCKPIG